MDNKYEAFISYRHKDLDTAAARALHRQIETYRIPAYIRRQSGRQQMGKVFRDQDELPLMANLGEGIRAALAASAWLIVICSPDLPLSKWCMAEVDYFIELGRRDRILTVLIAGEPEESFPPQLRFIETNQGEVEVEPLAADIRAQTPGASLRKLRREKLRVLAPMLGVGYDDLRRRQRERSLRHTAWICGAAAAVSLLAGAYVVRQNSLLTERNIVIQTQRDTALASESRMLAQNSLAAMAEGNIAAAVKLALLALPSDLAAPERPLIPEAGNALRSAMLYNDYTRYRPVAAFTGSATVAAPDGRTFAVLTDTAARVYDAETLRLIYEKKGQASTIDVYAKNPEVYGPYCTEFARYNREGDQLFLTSGLPNIINPHTGTVLREGLLTTPAELDDFGFSRYVPHKDYTGGRRVYDADTGELLFDFRVDNTTGKDLVSPGNAYYLTSIHAGVWLRSLPDGEILWALPGEEHMAVQGFTFFSPDARYLLLTDEKTAYTELPDGSRRNDTTWRLRLADTASGAISLSYEIPAGSVTSDVLPNARNVFESDEAARLFAPDSSLLLLPNGEAGYLDAYALPSADKKYTVAIGGFTSFSPDSRYILSGPLIYDAETGGRLADLSLPDMTTGDMRMLSEDTVLTVARAAGGDTACRLWSRPETPFTTVIDGTPIAVYPDDSHRLVVKRPNETNQEFTLLVTDLRTGATLFELEKPAGTMTSAPDFLLFFEDGAKLFGSCNLITDGYHNTNALIWDAETGALLRQYRDAYNKNISAVSPDGARAGGSYGVSDSAMGGAAVWDMETLEPIYTFENRARAGERIFDRDITRMLYSYENIIDVFDMTNGKLLFSLDGYPSGILALGTYNGFTADISPDGDILAAAHEKTGLIEIFDATGGERLRAIDAAGLKAHTLRLSHDGAKLLFATAQGDVRVYDTASGAEILSVYDPADTRAKQFSPDDRLIYGISGVRDATGGAKLLTVPAAGLRIRNVWLSPDGAYFICEYRGDAQTTLTKASRLPSLEEALAAAPQYTRDYEFTPEDRLRFALD
jgi:WD40 repeat protein